MPIYAPTLPPKPDLKSGQHPVAVLLRFDLKRMFRQKVGVFFLFGFLLTLLIQISMLYVRYLLNTKNEMKAVKDFAAMVLTQGPAYQADHLSPTFITFLWFFIAVVAGGLISRDTLYRVRPLMYAHPVNPERYLLAKVGFAFLVLLALMLPFILLPWGLSLAIAGPQGPVWATLPLHMVPAALTVAFLMACVTVGTSSLSGTPRAGTGWILSIFFVSWALGGLMKGVLDWPDFVSLHTLSTAWPKLLCGVPNLDITWYQALLGTLGWVALSLGITWTRIRPSEATL